MTPVHEPDLARELLSLCIRHPRSGSGAGAATPSISTSDESRDWDALIGLAIEQGVAPLVAVRTRPLRLPVAVRERLELIYSANSIRNLRLAAEESRVSSALGAAGVRHWPLKGPGLSERLYGDIGVRQISDIDLLVEPRSLARTDELLAELGYTRQTSGSFESLSAAQELIYVRNVPATSSLAIPKLGDHAPAGRSPRELGTPATSFHLDLHQRLLPYVRRDPLAARVFASGMTKENLLLYLCANQVTHRFARLRYLCDVTAFLEREGEAVEWNAFLSAARHMPWGPGVGLSLGWAVTFAHASVPARVIEALRPGPIGDLLLRRSLGDGAAVAATRTRWLDGPAGGAVSLGTAYLARPSAAGIAWRLMFPSRAYLREQTGALADKALIPAYATRLMRKIPAALKHLWKAAP